MRKPARASIRAVSSSSRPAASAGSGTGQEPDRLRVVHGDDGAAAGREADGDDRSAAAAGMGRQIARSTGRPDGPSRPGTPAMIRPPSPRNATQVIGESAASTGSRRAPVVGVAESGRAVLARRDERPAVGAEDDGTLFHQRLRSPGRRGPPRARITPTSSAAQDPAIGPERQVVGPQYHEAADRRSAGGSRRPRARTPGLPSSLMEPDGQGPRRRGL